MQELPRSERLTQARTRLLEALDAFEELDETLLAALCAGLVEALDARSRPDRDASL